MALSEKRQSQHWQERLEQERRSISVSVEETLAMSLDEQWLEEAEEDGIAEGSGKNTALIRPRLSLQSKMLPALRTDGFVQSATAAHTAFQQRQTHEGQREQRQAASQTNIFARLAQRLTSSFAALSLPPEEQLSPSVPSVSPESSLHPLATMSEPYQEEHRGVHEHQVIPNLSPPAQHVDEHELLQSPQSAIVKIIDAIPATPSTRPLAALQQTGPQRLAGRATKIRLQTAPHPQPTPPLASQETATLEKEHASEMAHGELLREPIVVNVRVRDVSEATTQPDLPALPRSSEARHGYQVQQEAAHETLFGTHTFESGQAEVMIAEERVQISSVVQVTLTSNPGQTLVQYISLHPQKGFTVHLTAPVSARTTFNYVLFVQWE